MMFTGTTQQQDTRFSDKEKKLMKQMKFGDCLNRRVDMTKVKLDVLRPWITKKITDILHIEDDVVVEFVYNQLEEEKYPCPKKMQINMTGFLNGRNARQFMGELWSLLLSAQDSENGIPAEFIHIKKDEILKRDANPSNDSNKLRQQNYQAYEDETEYVRSKNQNNYGNKEQKDRETGISAAVENLRTKLQTDVKPSSSDIKDLENTTKEVKDKGTSEQFVDATSKTKEKHSDSRNTSNKKLSSERLEDGSLATEKRNSNSDVRQESKEREFSQSPRKRFSNRDQKSRSLTPERRKNEGHKSNYSKQGSPSRHRSISRRHKSPTSTNGQEDEIRTKTSNICIEKKHRRRKSTSSDQSSVSPSPKLKSKIVKATEQPRRSRMSKSPESKRTKYVSCGGSSISFSSNADKKSSGIRKSMKSVQSKRQYRNNRCSSASSPEHEYKGHHREHKRRKSSKHH